MHAARSSLIEPYFCTVYRLVHRKRLQNLFNLIAQGFCRFITGAARYSAFCLIK